MYFSLPTKGNIHLILNLLINEINFTVRAKICFSLIVLCLYSVAHRKEACHPNTPFPMSAPHSVAVLYLFFEKYRGGAIKTYQHRINSRSMLFSFSCTKNKYYIPSTLGS